MPIVAEKHPVITSLGIKLHVPLGTERHARAAIDSRFVQSVLRDHLIRRHGHRIVAKERIKPREESGRWRGELLPALIQAAAADQINVDGSPRIGMDHWIKRERPLPDIPGRKSQRLYSSCIHIELIVIELQHQSDVWMEIVAGAGIEIPSGIDPPSSSSQGLGETRAHIESKGRSFLRADRTDEQ